MFKGLAYILLLGIVCSQQCRKFQCAEGGVVDKSDSTICAKVSGGMTTVGNCPEGTFCDLNEKESKTIKCHKKIDRKKLAGEKYDESPSECFTGKADEKKYCIGAGHGKSCANNGDADCDVDLYCSDKHVCEFARTEGQFCHSDMKCASYLICAWEDGVDTKCRPLGYYPSETQLGPGDEDEICKSKYLSPDFICKDGPVLEHSNLVDSPGHECRYTNTDRDLSRCFYHNEGWAICKKGAGQMADDWNRVVQYFHKHPSCHVSLPFAQCDKGREVMESQEEWEAVWLSLSRIHWENQMEGVLDCMKQWVHPEAFKYQIKKSSGMFMGISLMTMVLLFALLI